MIIKPKQSGFTAIELLITLFVASAFLITGYQLYAVILKDGGNTRSQARASNVAYDYLKRYSATATNPCVASTPLNNADISVSDLSSVKITVSLTCPYSATTSVTQISITMTYDTPQQTMNYSTYVTL